MKCTGAGDGGLSRRRFLRFGVLALAATFLPAHAPYGQWGVYRKKHLLILTTKVDPQSFGLGKEVARFLLQKLPESRAQVSRAPHKARIASLISSKQMDLALMRADDAAALRAGVAPYKDYGPVPLHIVAAVGDFLLVARDDFAPLHAWLITEALSDKEAPFEIMPKPSAKPESPDPRLPLHPGAESFLKGEAKPPAPAPDPALDDHSHD